jgi:hypothetical protein
MTMHYHRNEDGMNRVKCIEHVIHDGSMFDGRTEWCVYISYEEGLKLFSPEDLGSNTFPQPHSSWYSIPTDCWAFQWNDMGSEHDFWWTMDDDLARNAIEKYGWDLEVE